MLQNPSPFPFVGSKGFLAKSGNPVTIIRRNADGSALVRLDARTHQGRNRDASGNRTLPIADLFPTERDAVLSKRRKAAK